VSATERPRCFWGPRYWITWLALGVLRLLAPLSTPNQVRVGRVLGRLAYRLIPRRRHIAAVNIRLCFPELDAAAQRRLVVRCMEENAIGLLETARAWFVDPATIDGQLEVVGLDHLQRSQALGRGVIVIGAHYSCLDLGSVMASRLVRFTCMYRPHKNALMERVMCRARRRLCHLVDRRDMRAVVRVLKGGGVLWYAPDQDYGARVSVFAPFFGVPAATIATPSKLARVNNSPVLLVTYQRKADQSGYQLRFGEPLAGFPSGSEVADAARINAAIEAEIRRYPAQYMWVHRRFKTRPPGESGFY